MGVLDFMNKDRKEQADGGKNTEKTSTKNRKVISTKAKKRRCRALFIGINYPGTHAELRGCVNDVKMMMNVLEKIGFPMDDIRILVDTDEIRNCHAKPTKQNILDSMRWLVEGAQDGDTLFLHFSGHGTQVKDATGDEEDGKDEALVPCDFVSAGYLLDDEIVQNVLAPLPAGVRLTALLDCCHSGTLMDLPFIWIANEENTSRGLESGEALMKFSSKKSAARSLHSEDSDYIERDFAATGTSTRISADVVLFSGCRDEQTSADVTSRKKFNIPVDAGPGGAGGACTSALIEVLMSERNIPFVLLLEKMRVNLKARRFTQVPQLSASRPIDLTLPFSFFGLIHT